MGYPSKEDYNFGYRHNYKVIRWLSCYFDVKEDERLHEEKGQVETAWTMNNCVVMFVLALISFVLILFLLVMICRLRRYFYSR